MAYTTIDNPELFFQAKIYSGNGGTQSITLDGSEDMQPDWVWLKSRSNANGHELYDSVRGVEKPIYSNSSDEELTNANGLTAFGSDGFTLGLGASVNGSGRTFVSWNWKAGTSVSGNTGGSGTAKTYSGSVNTTSGFSITKFEGNGTAGHTIPHSLGVAPKWIVIKNLTSGSTNWQTYHDKLDNGAGTHEVFLDLNNAQNASSGLMNNTAPTSTVVTKGTGSYGNENNSNHIMYAFAEKQGYSKFGSYTGNGNADGTFAYTGFKPAFVIIKRTDSADNWYVYDTKRDTENPLAVALNTDTSGTEFSTSNILDFLSNGFKLRSSEATTNASGGDYIYIAFAESPFVNSNGVPNNGE